MRIPIITTTWLLLALGTAACGEQRTNPPKPAASILAHDTPRCYELQRTKSLYHAPPRLRLDTTLAFAPRGQVRDSAWRLTRLNAWGFPMTDRGRSPFLYWTAASADSIRIVISTGRSGSRLTVGAGKGDALQGRAVEFWDLGPSENDGGVVTLVRIPCIGPG